jgi:hypothetical protein
MTGSGELARLIRKNSKYSVINKAPKKHPVTTNTLDIDISISKREGASDGKFEKFEKLV